MNFGIKNFEQYEILLEISEKINEGEKLLQLKKKNEEKAEEYETKLNVIREFIKQKKEEHKNLEDTGCKSEISEVYVIFKTMEGCLRCIQAFEYGAASNPISRKLGSFCENRETAPDDDKLFNGQYMLSVEPGIEPSIINWQNLGIKSMNKFWRSLLTDIIAVILMGLSMLAVYKLKMEIEKIKMENPTATCSTKDLGSYEE